jgi:ArsR family transcriptional regulator
MSRHLSILRNAGIVTDQKISNHVVCRLATPCVMQFFRCVERIVDGDPEPCRDSSCGPGSGER